MFKKKTSAAAALISDIRAVTAALARANAAAAQCTDPLLFESTIYEIKYLQTRYAYLTNLARSAGIESRSFMPVERGRLWKKSS